MDSAALIQLLNRHNLRIFTTGDVASLAGLSPATASQYLIRLSRANVVARLKRGLWMNRLADGLNPHELVPHLLSPWPAYVSLYSALSEHGVVEEVPHVTYAVTAAIPRKLSTPLGSVHYHHLPERLIWGFEMRRRGTAVYPLAEPEKAFLDLCYLALTLRSPLGFPHRRGRRWNLDYRKTKKYAARFKYPPLLEYLRREKFQRRVGTTGVSS